MLIIALCKIVLGSVLLSEKCRHVVEFSACNSDVEFSKREINVVAHHLANATIYRASS